jgi:hypothetical protein
MALSISNERTVLWDQIQYSGDPQDFAWVLPVGPGAVLEASSDAWFEALDAVTSTRVSSPPLFCAGSSGFSGGGSDGSCSGFACGSSDSGGDGSAGGDGDFRLDPEPDDGVDVLHEGTVGPYETVTLHAEDGDSLQTWLTDNGYDLPADIEPVIAAYVEEGADFIALRLAPGQGVRQMTPVRVVTPGASTILPLRMVAAGTGSSVSIVLYVVGEGRYDTLSHPRAEVDLTELRWDWEAEESNWAELREEALAEGGFLTTFAQSDALRAQDVLPTGEVVSYRDSNGVPRADLANLYFAQAGVNAGGTASVCSTAIYNLGTTLEVAEGCEQGDEECVQEPGTTDAAVFTCDGHDDLSAALIGMRPPQVWVTRLEANLPRAALAEDLALRATNDGVVSNRLAAAEIENAPCDQVPASQAMSRDPFAQPQAGAPAAAGACGIRPLRPRTHTMAGIVGLLAASLVLRRLTRRSDRRRR